MHNLKVSRHIPLSIKKRLKEENALDLDLYGSALLLVQGRIDLGSKLPHNFKPGRAADPIADDLRSSVALIASFLVCITFVIAAGAAASNSRHFRSTGDEPYL